MIKEEYKNLLDEEFVPLVSSIDSSLFGLFEINKLGNIRVISTKRILKITPRPAGDYPTVYLRNGNNKFIYRIHLLIANTFLYNSDPTLYTEVDHIDRNTGNYSLSNLRWVTPSENKKNRVFSNTAFKKYDWWVSEDRKNFSKIDPKDSSWDHYFTNEEDLFLNYIFPDDWKIIPGSSSTYCSSSGLILFTERYNYITTGYTNKLGYKLVNINKKLYRVHRLVYSLFSEDVLGEKEFIDHVDTNRSNNRLENLKKVSQKENMNNPLTKKNLSRPVLQFDLTGNFIKRYSSCVEAYKNLGEKENSSSKISSCCKGTYISSYGYLWCYEGEEDTIPEKVKKIKKK